ncbi:uncharacterized protein LOC134770357 isoform X4 [Penaeus indicus]|uniref:uncharacterized protein LOC134770357 isoform X4 n=1 Tax=Penaeus indicus TaxID=29960 RepID=UPI00300CD6FA
MIDSHNMDFSSLHHKVYILCIAPCCVAKANALFGKHWGARLVSAGRWQRCGRTKATAVPLGKSKTLKGRRKKKKTLGKLVSEPPAECGEKKMASLDDEYSWSPPSEAELKVIEARRERNNKISSLIGQYLLKVRLTGRPNEK